MANSFSDRSRWTSRPPRPFPSSSPPLLSLYTTAKTLLSSCRCPQNSKINAFFFSPAEIVFSPPPKVSHSGSPRPPADQMLGKFVCLCRQLAKITLCLRCRFPHLLLRFCKQGPSTPPSYTVKMSGVRPVHSTLSSLFTPTIVASDFCAAAIGQETTVSSDCASSRLQTSWAELYCHIITP